MSLRRTSRRLHSALCRPVLHRSRHAGLHRSRVAGLHWSRVAGLGALGGALLVLVTAAALTAVSDRSAPVLGQASEAGAAEARVVTKPRIVWKPVPFGATRKAQMAAYCKRHYGQRSWRLKPKLIVLHFTAGGNWRSTWNYFSNNVADPEFHELPGPAAHFIIDKDGTIYQLVGTRVRTRHCYGLNHVAIGIEFVQEANGGALWADRQILNRKKQVKAGLRLVRWLQKKYGIRTTQVIGHSMATRSKYYKDLLGRRSAHGDWRYSSVKVFRTRLKRLN